MTKNAEAQMQPPQNAEPAAEAKTLPRAVLPVGRAAGWQEKASGLSLVETADGLMGETTTSREGTVRVLAPSAIAEKAKAKGWLTGSFTGADNESHRASPGSYFVVNVDGIALLARARKTAEGIVPGAVVGYLGRIK